jgi:hypothetical protein
MEYSWDITDIDVVNVDSQSNVIRSFTWTIIAAKDGYSSSYTSEYHSSEGLESVPVNAFTEFGDLTKDMCASWVQRGLGLELDTIKEELARQVKDKIKLASKTIVDAPW